MRITIEYDDNEKKLAAWIHLKCAECSGSYPDIPEVRHKNKIIFTNILKYNGQINDRKTEGDENGL